MGLFLFFFVLLILTVSAQTQDSKVLDTLFQKAVSSATTASPNKNIFQKFKPLIGRKNGSNEPCRENYQPNTEVANYITEDNLKPKNQQNKMKISNPIDHRLLASHVRRDDPIDHPKTIDEVNNLYHDNDLVGLESVVVPLIETEIPFDLSSYTNPDALDYNESPNKEIAITTTSQPIETTHNPVVNEEQYTVSSRRKNVEDYKTEEKTDCGDGQSNDYRRKNIEDSNDLEINVNTENKKGNEIVDSKSARQLTQTSREKSTVCYACSTASNPNCLVPNERTTIKYCRDSCITKIFNTADTRVLTRDCGSSCNEGSLPGLSPKYSKCSVCHDDLCNGTYTINIQNLFLIYSLLFVSVLKCVFV